MGNVYNGISKELALKLQAQYGLKTFIETGTLEGWTSAWAADHFERVITIEKFVDYYNGSRQRHAEKKNIWFLLGDSAVVLQEVLRTQGEPALVFLDAHWGGGLHYPKPVVECPLLQELDALNHFNPPHVIIIDDARLFVPITPAPGWPSQEQVNARLRNNGKRAIFVIDDEIIGIPKELGEFQP